MTGLVNREKRERARQARTGREAAILEAAAHLFLNASFPEVTLDAVGQRAGVPRGTPSLYFGSRAALFLHVLEAEVSAWSEGLFARLEALPGEVAPEELAHPLAASVAASAALARLVALFPIAIEERGDLSPAGGVVRRLGTRLAAVASALETRAPALGSGGGVVVLRRLAATAAGVETLRRCAQRLVLLGRTGEVETGLPSLEDELTSLMRAVLRSA